MIRTHIIRNLESFYKKNEYLLIIRSKSTAIDIDKLEKEASIDIDVLDDAANLREEELERKRNKSRLRESDRNLLFEQNPYPEPILWTHGTLKYMRRVYGRYGEASGINPSICWPVKQELDEAIYYERLAYPKPIMSLIEQAKAAKVEKERSILERQATLVKKMESLEDMKADLRRRLAKKQDDALAAKEKRERLIEEVRMHFGYTVDPKEEKFKELLEKKEKEQKKADKELRRKAKEQDMLAKMFAKKT